MRGLVVRHGPREALRGVDLTLAPGTWVALLGPNGAGKTTLLSAIAALLPAAEGCIEVAGHAVAAGRPAPGVGLVPQDIASWPSLTARENLEIAAALHAVPRRERADRVAWALSWIGLRHRADDPVAKLSGGMRRRLNVAAAVLHRPRLVLLDEPTVGVDPPARRRVREMLAELQEDGAALLQSTHELDEVERVSRVQCRDVSGPVPFRAVPDARPSDTAPTDVAGRVVVLDGGRVVADGTVDQVVTAAAGAGRSVHLTLDAPVADADVPEGFTSRGRQLSGRLHDVGRELPELLARLTQTRRRVLDLTVEPPALSDVFARLTSKGMEE